jgi:DNA-binding IclR family transcriptional regulator
MTPQRTNSVPALERALIILEFLGKSKHGLTLSQVTRYLGLPKSSVHSLLLTFERCGYLHREVSSGRYRLGLRVCELANMALNSISLREDAAPALRRLAEGTGMTVHLAILEHGEAVLIDKFEPSGCGLKVATWPGKRLSLHCTSVGKSLAAYLPEERLDLLIARQGLLRHNDNTIGSARKLKAELALTRQRGYALDDEEEEIGFRCIGAPILNSRQEAVAAISIAGTTAQIDSENRQRLAGQVMAAARSISECVQVSQRSSDESPAPAELHAAAASIGRDD